MQEWAKTLSPISYIESPWTKDMSRHWDPFASEHVWMINVLYADKRRRMHADTDACMQTQTHACRHQHKPMQRWMQTQADECRHILTQTHARRCKQCCKTNTEWNMFSVWVDATTRRVQTLHVCSRSFRMHYIYIQSSVVRCMWGHFKLDFSFLSNPPWKFHKDGQLLSFLQAWYHHFAR